ncbi:DIS3-like exonuclease 1 [Stegodyphus dumicola]|uniref:DIS3-like exonuclease 1 n=1 Tax=Stegodyphus dumicola TaxID=202533 RepID=UPI0015AC4712|nr:DIS3-like exonuclease 1 [Stegodyphus dumicola]
MWPGLDSALQLYESFTLALSAGSVKDLSKSYENYLPTEILEAGIKAGRFYKGYLRVNKHNALQEAFVASSKSFIKDSGDIFVCGMIDRNRAIHGDEVVVEMLPEQQWKSRCLRLVDNPYDAKENGVDIELAKSQVIPTGKVVGILDRRWRNYIATLPEEEESNSSSRKNERILVIPYDYRIPKIRIVTKQAEGIRNHRIVVRIDNWDKESQYPNGHLVQTLGEIGELETEIQCLLIEHDIFVGEFAQNLILELPSVSEEKPGKPDESEIKTRKDLRSSHFIFSIDPKGCEDVDDALSVKELSNGMLELGVHIADVTYFVQPLSATDLEARSRSTSVYLPDRRYDMLPQVLSGNLCSLLGNVDRYAVSVLWELDSECNVQNVWYGRTVINSRYKLCYEAAQDILFGATAEEMISEIPELQGLNKCDLNSRFQELSEALSKLYQTANIIRQSRLLLGGLELNSINMKFEIDHSLAAAVTDVKSSKELAIHKTVAECMIFANHWVAKKISEAFPHHAVLRHHPNPREADLLEVQKLASSKGFALNIHSNKELAASLEKAVNVNDPTFNQILRILTTQAMNQAVYFCSGNISSSAFYHYGLGLDKYTHFTSPIRRYADILVHRQLLAEIEKSEADVKFDAGEMTDLCNHMNIKHRAVQDLEKAAQQIYLAYFFEDYSRQNSSPCLVDAVIYSLLTNGMLVFIPKYGIKGAVSLCNKDKKVAIVKDGVEWLEGQLTIKNSSLTVEASGMIQKYSIFDHVTLSVRIQKSRAHQHKIILDLVRNVPYASDIITLPDENIEMLPIKSETGSEEITKNVNENLLLHEAKTFNLYDFLENLRALTLIDYNDTSLS